MKRATNHPEFPIDDLATCELLGVLPARSRIFHTTGPHAFIKGIHAIRQQVTDVARAAAFYTQHLGFKLGLQHLPAFATVSLGDAQILLCGPGAAGSGPPGSGQPQEPGGGNRVVLRVDDLPGLIGELEKAGIRFRTDMETGPAGREIQIEDPDGNPIELFEPAR